MAAGRGPRRAARPGRPHDPPGTLAALGFIVLGVVLALQTEGMTPMGSVFPLTISLAMIVLSAVLVAWNVVRGLRPGPDGAPDAPAEEPASGGGGSNRRRAAFLVAMAAWVALVPVLGFLLASGLAYFSIMAIAVHERMSPRSAALLVAIGLAVLLGFTLLMASVLNIPLPGGLLF